QAQLDATPRHKSVSDSSGPASITGSSNSNPAINAIVAAQSELTRLEAARTALLSKGYLAQHPDVTRNQREIALAEATVKRLKAALPSEKMPPSSAPAIASSSSIEAGEDPLIAQLKSNLEANRVEIGNLINEE